MTQSRDMAVLKDALSFLEQLWLPEDAGLSENDSKTLRDQREQLPELIDRIVQALANRDATGSGSSAKADPHRAAEGAVLDKDQLKAIEHAAMDAGAYSWRRARLAMVEDGKVIGYPVFSRADMAELARLYREDAPAINTTAGEEG